MSKNQEPELEWGVKYVQVLGGKQFEGEEWGYPSDPRLPHTNESGHTYQPEIQDGNVWINRDDRVRVVAVAKRPKLAPEEWETYNG